MDTERIISRPPRGQRTNSLTIPPSMSIPLCSYTACTVYNPIAKGRDLCSLVRAVLAFERKLELAHIHSFSLTKQRREVGRLEQWGMGGEESTIPA